MQLSMCCSYYPTIISLIPKQRKNIHEICNSNMRSFPLGFAPIDRILYELWTVRVCGEICICKLQPQAIGNDAEIFFLIAECT